MLTIGGISCVFWHPKENAEMAIATIGIKQHFYAGPVPDLVDQMILNNGHFKSEFGLEKLNILAYEGKILAVSHSTIEENQISRIQSLVVHTGLKNKPVVVGLMLKKIFKDAVDNNCTDVQVVCGNYPELYVHWFKPIAMESETWETLDEQTKEKVISTVGYDILQLNSTRHLDQFRKKS